MPYLLCQRGITLIEVLVALLVFSIGLMGVAALLTVSARSVHSAFLRTQVTFLAQNMAERMQANPIGTWRGYYDGSYPAAQGPTCESGCSPPQLAAYDRGVWSSQLETHLPRGVKASINCDQAGLSYRPTPDQIMMRPPYGGRCAMAITWTEQGSAGFGSDGRSLQTFAWKFQP